MIVKLSQRNLLTLLHQLAIRGKGLLRKPGGPVIVVETDEQHYQGREYGCMSPSTETFITEMKGVISRIEQTPRNPPDWAVEAACVVGGPLANVADILSAARIITRCACEAGVR